MPAPNWDELPADYKAVLDSYNVFRDGLGPWFGLAEKAMLDFLAE